jgi:3'(2'), 5'-bisphosphate nucleotidase
MEFYDKEIVEIAREAGSLLLTYQRKNLQVDDKGGFPVSEADIAADKYIRNKLGLCGIPILSEEKVISYAMRRSWKRYWLVDPLDGTKEFIKGGKDFTVNIALIEEGSPSIGVVYAPAKDCCYYNDKRSAYKDGKPIQVRQTPKIPLVTISKSHLNEETKRYLASVGKHKTIQQGSSLKVCLIAEGKADIYPRLGTTMEWDTAAAHAIVRKACKEILDFYKQRPLRYNKKDLRNPWFIVK